MKSFGRYMGEFIGRDKFLPLDKAIEWASEESDDSDVIREARLNRFIQDYNEFDYLIQELENEDGSIYIGVFMRAYGFVVIDKDKNVLFTTNKPQEAGLFSSNLAESYKGQLFGGADYMRAKRPYLIYDNKECTLASHPAVCKLKQLSDYETMYTITTTDGSNISENKPYRVVDGIFKTRQGKF